jgi:hypothetical protein
LINDVVVHLELPPQARLHDVFHVGLLKKFHGDPPAAPRPCHRLIMGLLLRS